MARAARRIREYLQAIDVVVEVVDARVAVSGRNPLLDELAGSRDASSRSPAKIWPIPQRPNVGWTTLRSAAPSRLRSTDERARSVARVATAIEHSSVHPKRGIARAMIVGIPNSGKSSIINGLLRRAAAKTENRAGVTRQLSGFV